MILVTTYKLKPFLSKEETRELMEVFAKEGAGPGAGAHYVNADGGGGLVISEADDVEGAYRNILNYTEWVEYDTQAMLTIEQALPQIQDALGLGGTTKTEYEGAISQYKGTISFDKTPWGFQRR